MDSLLVYIGKGSNGGAFKEAGSIYQTVRAKERNKYRTAKRNLVS
jgi:hypothetical protein